MNRHEVTAIHKILCFHTQTFRTAHHAGTLSRHSTDYACDNRIMPSTGIHRSAVVAIGKTLKVSAYTVAVQVHIYTPQTSS